MRVFVAVVPDEDARRSLAPSLTCLHEWQRTHEGVGLRVSSVEKLHVTLCFMARVEELQLEDLSAGCARIAAAAPAMSLALGGAGAFPSARAARVLWLGVQEGGAQLSVLAVSLAALAARLGIATEARAFHPHLTLARVTPALDARPLVRALDAAQPSVTMNVKSLALIRSHTDASGTRYETLECFPLAEVVS